TGDEPLDRDLLRLGHVLAVPARARDRGAVLEEPLAREAFWRLHRAHDRQAEALGELPVALVLAGHGHDRARAVAEQHVVGDPDRDAALRIAGLVRRIARE